MRILLDTNVVLDVLLNRHPWVIEAAAVEDNLQIACAEMMGLDAIVTRDTSGFKVAPPLLALTPNELIRQLHLP